MPQPPDTDGSRIAEAAELAALRSENDILRQTLDAIDGTVVVYDANQRFVMANRAYHEYFPHLPPDSVLAGQPYENVLALSIAAGSVIEPDAYKDPAAYIERRKHDLDRRDDPPRETYDRRADRWSVVRVRYTPDGHRVALRVDITEQKRLQAQLAEARVEAERANRAKSQFLANISHELRTPLNAVINFARLMNEQIHGPLGAPDYLEYARSIHDSGANLLRLIEQVLDFARSDAGGLTLSEQPVNLRGLLESVSRLLLPEASRSGIELRTSVPADLPAVLGDSARLRQVLVSLLTNALKFAAGTSGGRVSLSARVLPDRGGIEVLISDNGPGIGASDLARVLQPFERAADPTMPGVGLGLALAQRLVSLHGGTLTLDSAPGRGTVARVRLPPDRVLPRT
jgi:signal transduction histidine kinase